MVAFIEGYCRLVKGAGARKAPRLRGFQHEVIEGLFTEPRPRRGYVQMGRKNGKSLLAAWIGLYMLCADGEEGAEVYCAAGDENQAKVVWKLARRVVEVGPLSEIVQVYANELVHEATDSVMKPLSSDADLRLGLNPSAVLFDEVANQPDGRLWDAYSTAMDDRDRPLMLGITTPGHDPESLAYSLYEMRNDPDPEFFCRIWEPSDLDAEVDDEDAWHEANPGLGDWLQVEDMRSNMRELVRMGRENTFKRLRMGLWTSASEVWIPRPVWDACARPDRVIEPGEDVVVSIDGSQSHDATAVAVCTVEDKPHLALLGMWEPLETGEPVPVGDVEACVKEACGKYHVLEVSADKFRFERTLQALAMDGVPVVEFPQSQGRLGAATSSMADAVHGGEVTHSGDERLALHVQRVTLKVGTRGTWISKERRRSKRTIDAAMAAMMAFDRARWHAAQPKAQIYFIDY